MDNWVKGFFIKHKYVGKIVSTPWGPCHVKGVDTEEGYVELVEDTETFTVSVPELWDILEP